MKNDEIQKFMDDNDELFRSLAEDLLCPCCKKVVKPPFFNLGESFHSAEGCKSCHDQINSTVVS